jgi:type IV pilus assembly protein PilA
MHETNDVRKGVHMMFGPAKGFTLIELLIVVAIIGIIAAIAIPQYANYRLHSFNAAALSDLKNFRAAMEAYHSDNGTYP